MFGIRRRQRSELQLRLKLKSTIPKLWRSVNASIPSGEYQPSGLYYVPKSLKRQEFSERQKEMEHHTEKSHRAGGAKSLRLRSLPEVMVKEWMHGVMSSMLQSLYYGQNAVDNFSTIQTSFSWRMVHLAIQQTIHHMKERNMVYPKLIGHPVLQISTLLNASGQF